MNALPFFLAAAALFLLAAHPFTTYPLSLLILARLGSTKSAPIQRADAVRRPTFAICTCAYNEEKVIEAKILNLLQLRSNCPDLEILIYVDAASDRTAEICERYAGQIKLYIAAERHGKTRGMNILVQRTKADIIVFTDANVRLAPDVLNTLGQHFDDSDVGCVCGNLNYVNPEASVTAQSGSLYWRIEEGIKRLESATGSVIGADGSLFAIRSALHRPPPDDIIDDFYVSLLVLIQGKRVIQASDVKAFEETVAVSSEEFQRKTRIACQAFNVHRMLWPQIRRLDALTIYKYVSHKLLRWIGIYTLMGTLALALIGAAIAGWWLAFLALALSPALLWAFGSRWAIRPFAQVYDIFSAFLGAGLGVLQSVRGERFQTWSPAASLRSPTNSLENPR